MFAKIFLFCLAGSVLSKQALNFKYFESQDKNHDGKLNKSQFLEGLKQSVIKSVFAN